MNKRKKKRYDSVDIVSFVCLTVFAILIVIPFWNDGIRLYQGTIFLAAGRIYTDKL